MEEKFHEFVEKGHELTRRREARISMALAPTSW